MILLFVCISVCMYVTILKNSIKIIKLVVELYRGVHEHPLEYLMRPSFLESLCHLVSQTDRWRFRKMSHDLFIATFLTLGPTAFKPQSEQMRRAYIISHLGKPTIDIIITAEISPKCIHSYPRPILR